MKAAASIALLAAVCVLGTAAQPASAGLLLIEEATEVMMESQGLQGTYLGLRLGPDDASTLRFTSRVDTTSFSYVLEFGTTYLGQSASWTTTGSRDDVTGLWTWVTNCVIGSVDLSNTGTGGPFVGVDPPYFTPIEIPPLPLTTTLVSDVTYTKKDGKTTSEGTITVKDFLTDKVLSSGKHTDTLINEGPDKGKWKWDTGLLTNMLGKGSFQVSAEGFSPLPDGGLGAFALNVRAVPEPSSIILAATGGLVAFGVGHRRQRRREPLAKGRSWTL